MFFIDNIITIITIILMLVAWWLFYGKKFFQNLKENPYFENDASQAFASLGVLGTFIGITFGLLFFDTHNLEKSVPALLDGMKSAFFTSIVGMAGSLGTKWYTIDYSALDELENKDTAMDTNKSSCNNNTENSENDLNSNEQSKLPKWTNGKLSENKTPGTKEEFSENKTPGTKEEFSENKSNSEQSICPIWSNATVHIDKLDRPDWTNASVQNEQTNTINNNRNYLQENTTTINSENTSVVDNIFNAKAKKKALSLLAIKCGIQSKSIKTFLNKYSLDTIEKQLLLLEKALKNNNNIKNPSGWLCSALQNDYTDSEKETITLKEQTKQENTIKASKQEKLQRKALGLNTNSKSKKQLDENTRIKNLETLRAFISSI